MFGTVLPSYSLSICSLLPPHSSACRPLSLVQALIDICSKVSKACPSKLKQGTAKPDSTVASSKSCVQAKAKPFDSMNNIAANLLLNLTRWGAEEVRGGC